MHIYIHTLKLKFMHAGVQGVLAVDRSKIYRIEDDPGHDKLPELDEISPVQGLRAM